ncbi:adenosine deaminase [Treponema sp. OMZ 840]|uniref:adenosine deaminase n=1 Tax=Treponema sp. OMZ 840 TaxID=244313 RepID=UPI003D923665
MTSVAEFKSRPKMDAHNHLNLGMRYASYIPWAGFYIPDFPRKFNGLNDMHTVISEYTRPRCITEKDVQDLLTLSIQDAVADGVTILEGSIDIGFIHHCGENVTRFLDMIRRVEEKFKTKIEFRPELGMGKTFDAALVKRWAPECMHSGVFKSIDLYGPEVEDGIEEFKPLYKLAEKLGIKKKAHVGEFSDAKSVKRFVQIFDLDEVQHGIGAATDKSVMKFLCDKNIRLHVCPASNVMLSAVPSLEAHPIKILYENGVNVTIATDDLLFFNKSISEQCVDLVEAGVLTKEQVFNILDKSVEK